MRKDVSKTDIEVLLNNYNFDDETIKEILSMKVLYDKVVKNYAELTGKLEIDHPLELYVLFINMLNGGYLSPAGPYKYDANGALDIYEIKKLNGINILAGIGICKHVSSLFSSILDEKGMPNYQVAGYLYNEKEKYQLLRKTLRYINMVKDVGLKQTLEYPYAWAISNHCINKAIYKNANYFLDCCNFHVFVPTDDSLNELKDDNTRVFIREEDYHGNNFNNTDEYYKRRGKIFSVIDDNYSLIKGFYLENRDNYIEAKEKVRTLSKKINK